MACWAPHNHGDNSALADGLIARYPDAGEIITRLWSRYGAYAIDIRMDQWAAVRVECEPAAKKRIVFDIDCDGPHLGLAEALRRLDDADFVVTDAQKP